MSEIIKDTAQNTIKIPKNITEIEPLAFRDMEELKEINVDENNANYSSEDGILYNKDKTVLIRVPEGRKKDVIIPNTVTQIGNYAFSGCAGLISIEIPYSVTSIGNYTFSDCANLVSIIVASGNTKYTSTDGNGNECNCIIEKSSKKLIVGCKTTVIPSSVTQIGSSAFYGCVNLTSITLPSSITTIDSYAFEGCTDLTRITIPSNVTSIGACAFRGCSSLTRIGYSGTKLTSIGSYAFEGCTNLENAPLGGVKSVGDYAFRGCVGLKTLRLVGAPTIHPGAFTGCTNVTSAIFGEGTYLCANIFDGWTSSQTINFIDSADASERWSDDWKKGCSANIVWGYTE